MSDNRLAREFAEFHAANPHVYRLFVRFAYELIHAGWGVLSASVVVERIRWETAIDTRSDDGFKINNNFRAFYSRLFEEDFPQNKGRFRMRASAADRGRREQAA